MSNDFREERGWVEDQPQHSPRANPLRLVEDDTATLRFMARCQQGMSVP